MAAGISLTLWLALRTLFLLLGSLICPQFEDLFLVLLYPPLSSLVVSWRTVLLKEKQRGVDLTGEGKWAEAWRSRRRENCHQETLYEVRIYFQLKNKIKI